MVKNMSEEIIVIPRDELRVDGVIMMRFYY